MSDGSFTDVRIIYDGHSEPITYITSDESLYCTLLGIGTPPHNGYITSLGCLFKKLFAQMGFGPRSLGNHQQA